MALVQPPLFIQVGSYTAKADRSLIGALLAPSGSGQAPRAGVRPSGLTSGLVESSFRVSAGTNGNVTIAAGAAFVLTTEPLQPLNGVYLVVNEADETVSCAVSGVVVGAAVKVYVQVRDASFLPSPSRTAEARFVVAAASDPAPDASLLLAQVTWRGPTAAPDTVQDKRVFTSGLGGVVQVQTKAELTGSAGSVPYGSLGYVHGEGLVYVRSGRGWEPLSGVSTVGSRPAPGASYDGMLFYNAADGVVEMYSAAAAGWVTVGSRRAVVGRTLADLSTTTRHVVTKQTTETRHCWLQLTPGAFKSFDDPSVVAVTNVTGNGKKPTEDSLSIRVRVFSKGTIVSVVLTASGWVPTGSTVGTSSVTYANANANLAVDVKKYSGGNPTTLVTNPDTGSVYVPDTYSSGLTFYEKMDVLKSRTIHYQLDPGDYMFSVQVSHSGDPSTPTKGFFQLHQIILEVAS